MTAPDHGDALPLLRTLDDWAEHHAEEPSDPAIIWQTTVPSRTHAGAFYTVTAYSDKTYSCDCPGRQYQHKCRHIKGAVMMLEGQEIFRELAEPKKEPKKLYALKEYITGHRQHRNSMISWLDEDFQAMLPDQHREVLQAIIDRPGLTRNRLSAFIKSHGSDMLHTTVVARVSELKLKLDLVIEGESEPGPSGKPRARLYPNHEMLIVEKGA